MLMMNDLGSMAAGMLPFDPAMCGIGGGIGGGGGGGGGIGGGGGGGGGGLYEHQPPPKPRFVFKMPRVVPDQKNKFDTDELFRRLSRESDVSPHARRFGFFFYIFTVNVQWRI